MPVAKITLSATVHQSYDLRGQFGLSDQNGLVYIAHHENAIKNGITTKHALELLLDGSSAFDVKQFNDTIDRFPDSVVPIHVDTLDIEPSTPGVMGKVGMTNPGDMFVNHSGVYLTGKPEEAGGGRHFLIEQGIASYLQHGDVMVFKNWTLRGYLNSRLVLEVARISAA
jgi:hypothetical protein